LVQPGHYNRLKVLRITPIGAYLDDGNKGILLPNRFMPNGLKEGDEPEVFIYHDSEDRLIATTQKPYGQAGDIVYLRAVSVTPQGAFLDTGLMKDLFVPRSQQLTGMRPNGQYLVKIYVDEQTSRMAATEKFAYTLSNDALTVQEMEEVDLVVYRRTDIGYVCIINNRHTGVLHFNEIFRNIQTGDRFRGFVKAIHPPAADSPGSYRIDVLAGKPGYQRVEDETERVLRLLRENGGFLPYHDKSDPEAIYDFFGMSKKTFKMVTGNLYKQRRILLEPGGIRLK